MKKKDSARPFRRSRLMRFASQPRCRVCTRKIDFGELCYYCRKRRTS